ncbi:MAG: UDP-N-acetylmuramate--L-alanine ligase [Clostridia bacterium]|nr:UDP-N-acetylmuramate--L-alanine ligase [Clostridia bacterium]
MRKSFLEFYDSFYFIGIGGVSMSGLAKYILACGKKVGGSDNYAGVYTEELSKMGAKIEIAESKGSVKYYDVVVYTDAVKENDIQLIEAHELNKTVLSRGQLLYEISRDFKKVIGVSGCHGKTTCTAMLAHVFACAGAKFGVHIGGRDKTFLNGFYSGRDFFITEACEYKKNFLLLKPDIAVVLNSAPDHLECYGSVANLRSAYNHFADSAEIAIVPYGDLKVEGITFGYEKNARFCAKRIVCTKGRYSFTVFDGDGKLGNITLSVYGKHNVLNALAATAAARSAGIPFARIKEGLADFTGVERRFENIGKYRGARCIADYAHHPDEISATLTAVKKINDGRLFVVFQPHTYSRTKNLFQEFVKVLSGINNLLIYRTFAAREYFDDKGSALTLSHSVKKSRYGDNIEDITDFLRAVDEDDTVLFLGAGDIYDIAKYIINIQVTK